jgi:hypothetical protein
VGIRTWRCSAISFSLKKVPNPDFCEYGFDNGYMNPDSGTQFFSTCTGPKLCHLKKRTVSRVMHITGLSFTLNYCRPTYFMLEAAPIIEKFSRRFGLAILDLNDIQPVKTSKTCQALNLIHSYEKANMVSTRRMIHNLEPNGQGPPEKAFF